MKKTISKAGKVDAKRLVDAKQMVADLKDHEREWIDGYFVDTLKEIDEAAYYVWKELERGARETAEGIGVPGCYVTATIPEDFEAEAVVLAEAYAAGCTRALKKKVISAILERGVIDTAYMGIELEFFDQFPDLRGEKLRASIVDSLGLADYAVKHGWSLLKDGGRDCVLELMTRIVETRYDIYESANVRAYRLSREAADKADAEALAIGRLGLSAMQMGTPAAGADNEIVAAVKSAVKSEHEKTRGEIAEIQKTIADGFDDVCGSARQGSICPITIRDVKDEKWLDDLNEKWLKVWNNHRHEMRKPAVLRLFLDKSTYSYRGYSLKELCHNNIENLQRALERVRTDKYR